LIILSDGLNFTQSNILILHDIAKIDGFGIGLRGRGDVRGNVRSNVSAYVQAENTKKQNDKLQQQTPPPNVFKSAAIGKHGYIFIHILPYLKLLEVRIFTAKFTQT
jgi:hypothetical protein